MKTELIPKLKSMGAEKLPEEELFEYIVTADISALQKMLRKNPGMINAMYHGETVFMRYVMRCVASVLRSMMIL